MVDIAAELLATAQVSLSQTSAGGIGSGLREIVKRINARNLSDRLSDFIRLIDACSNMCDKVADSEVTVHLDRADLLFKASIAVLHAFIADEFGAASSGTTGDRGAWYDRFERYRRRIERVFSDEERSKIVIHIDKGEKILKWMAELAATQTASQTANAGNVNAAKTADVATAPNADTPENESNLFARKNYLIFRVLGRRYAVPLSSTRGVGRLGGGAWMCRTVRLGEFDFPLYDMKEALGSSGEAGGVFVVITSRQGRPLAWAVDGVEQVRANSEIDGWEYFHFRPIVSKSHNGRLISGLLSSEQTSRVTPIYLLDTEALGSLHFEKASSARTEAPGAVSLRRL